jgi:transcriptional regulator with XRE-family HTH domain
MPVKSSVPRPSDATARGAEPDLGHLLRSARAHRRLTLREVEAATGIPNPHLSQIERGVIRRPDQQIVWKLSRLYHLDFALIWQWMEGEGDAKNARFAAALNVLNDLSDADLERATEYLERLDRRGRTRRPD